MHCRDASLALDTHDRRDLPAEVRAHLLACPRCAGQAEAAGRLDRLWEATRPCPPEPDAWEAAWARIDREVAEPAPATLPIGGRRRFVAGLGVALAAAAALVVAFVTSRPDGEGGRLPGGVELAGWGSGPIEGTFEALSGRTELYHVDDGTVTVIQVNEPEHVGFLGILEGGRTDEFYMVLNVFESAPASMASNDGPANPFATASP